MVGCKDDNLCLLIATQKTLSRHRLLDTIFTNVSRRIVAILFTGHDHQHTTCLGVPVKIIIMDGVESFSPFFFFHPASSLDKKKKTGGKMN